MTLRQRLFSFFEFWFYVLKAGSALVLIACQVVVIAAALDRPEVTSSWLKTIGLTFTAVDFFAALVCWSDLRSLRVRRSRRAGGRACRTAKTLCFEPQPHVNAGAGPKFQSLFKGKN